MLAEKWIEKSAKIEEGPEPNWVGARNIFFPRYELDTMLAPKLPTERKDIIGFEFQFHQWNLQITDEDPSGYLCKRTDIKAEAEATPEAKG